MAKNNPVDVMIDKKKRESGYHSFAGHGAGGVLKPPPGMTPEQERKWHNAVKTRKRDMMPEQPKPKRTSVFGSDPRIPGPGPADT